MEKLTVEQIIVQRDKIQSESSQRMRDSNGTAPASDTAIDLALWVQSYYADGKAADDSFCEILRGFKEAGASAELNAKGSVHRSHLQGHWEGISAAYYAAYLKLNDWLAVKYGKNHTKSPDRSPDNNTPQASEDKGLADERTAISDFEIDQMARAAYNSPGRDFDCLTHRHCFTVGAKWMRDQMLKSPTPPQEKDKQAPVGCPLGENCTCIWVGDQLNCKKKLMYAPAPVGELEKEKCDVLEGAVRDVWQAGNINSQYGLTWGQAKKQGKKPQVLEFLRTIELAAIEYSKVSKELSEANEKIKDLELCEQAYIDNDKLKKQELSEVKAENRKLKNGVPSYFEETIEEYKQVLAEVKAENEVLYAIANEKPHAKHLLSLLKGEEGKGNHETKRETGE